MNITDILYAKALGGSGGGGGSSDYSTAEVTLIGDDPVSQTYICIPIQLESEYSGVVGYTDTPEDGDEYVNDVVLYKGYAYCFTPYMGGITVLGDAEAEFSQGEGYYITITGDCSITFGQIGGN